MAKFLFTSAYSAPSAVFISRLAAPVADFFQAFAARMFEEPYEMPRVFEFMDVGPDFSPPSRIVSGRFSASGAASVQRYRSDLGAGGRHAGQLDKDAAHLFDFLFGPKKVFVTEKVAESKFLSLDLGFAAGMEWPVFGP